MNRLGVDETICPIAINIDGDVKGCDAELEVAVANLNNFNQEEIENDTCVVDAESQNSNGSTQCIDDTKSVCMEASNDNIKIEDDSGPVVFENLKNKESSINNIVDPKVFDNSKKKRNLSVKSLKICKLNEEDVFKKLDELAKTQLSLPDQLLLIETRNSWGRVLFKRPKCNLYNIELKYCLEEVWNPWQAATLYRDYPLSYKCYICDKAWWHLYPFADHINNSIHISITFKLECKGYECSIVAFNKKKRPVRDIPMENECWRCGNDYQFHQRELQSDNTLYHCSYCAKGFYTCFLFKEHLPGCMQYRRSLRRSKGVDLQFYKCHLCKIVMTSKEDALKHYSNYHDVRSDLPIITPNRICRYCNQIYFIKLLHICPKTHPTKYCRYCSRRFSSSILLQMHGSLSILYFHCRVCSEVLKSQCMEVSHLVEKHSERFVLIPICSKCDENVLFLNDESIWRHMVLEHFCRFPNARTFVEMVLVPKDCLSTKQLALLNIPWRGNKGAETEEELDKADTNESQDNDINMVIAKFESSVDNVDDRYEITDISDPTELFNGATQNAQHIVTNVSDQSNKDSEQIQEAAEIVEDSDDESLIVYKHTVSKEFSEELNSSMEIERKKKVDRNHIDSVTKTAVQEESTNTIAVKIKEEPTDTGVVKILDEESIRYIQAVLQLTSVKNRKCAVCSKVLARKCLVKGHLIVHLLTDAQARSDEHSGLKCQNCLKTFQDLNELRQHLREHFSLPSYVCHICSKCFSHRSDRNRHMKMHELRECDMCGKKFHDLHKVAQHIKKHEENPVLNCEHCSKVFYSEDMLNGHTRKHHVETWQVHKKKEDVADCPICGVSFCKCDICLKHFTKPFVTKKHLKIVHKVELPECDMCGMKFYQLHILAHHIKIHEKNAVINCDRCSKVFYSQRALNKHTLSVHGKASFQLPCGICKVKFKSRKRESVHMWRVHKQRSDGTYCPICVKSFRRYIDAKKHVKKFHPGQGPLILLNQLKF